MSTKENSTQPGRIGCVTQIRVSGCFGTERLVRNMFGNSSLSIERLLTSRHIFDLAMNPHHRPISADLLEVSPAVVACLLQ